MNDIPNRFRVRCEFGDHEIDTRTPGIFQWTSGWVMQREGGGGHGISLAQRENRWVCRYHMERRIKGFTDQRELFGAKT